MLDALPDLQPPSWLFQLINQPLSPINPCHHCRRCEVEEGEGACSCCHLLSVGVCGRCHCYSHTGRCCGIFALLTFHYVILFSPDSVIPIRRLFLSPSHAWRQIRRHCTALHVHCTPLPRPAGPWATASCTTNSFSPASLQADLRPSPYFLTISLNLHSQSPAFTQRLA